MKIAALIMALCAGKLFAADIVVRSELVDGTNTVHWQTVASNTALAIVTINLTNEPVPVRRDWWVEYDGWGFIDTSTNLVDWHTILVRWTPRFAIASDEPRRFYRVTETPELIPTTGRIR